MYTQEEAKNIRETFWNQFKAWSGSQRTKNGLPGRWIMNDTGIKQLRLKFHFDEHIALAGIEIDTRNLDKRIALWEKLESLQRILEEMAGFPISWDLEYPVSDDKTSSRIYAQLTGVSIYQQNDWKKVQQFLYDTMSVFEAFFTEYRDILKYS